MLKLVLAAAAVGSAAAFAPTAVRTHHRRAGAVSAAAAGDAQRAGFDEVVQNTYGRYPISIVDGAGSTLRDDTGKTYLDFVAGISTCALGHAHEGLATAVSEQMRKVHHVSNLYYTANQGELAKWLVDHSPADKAFFCNSGAEANEAAIKLARLHAHQTRGLDLPVIITAHSSFHGRTLAALTATAQPKYQEGFGPMVPGFEYVTYNDAEGLEKLVNDIEARSPGKTGVAGILMEALQGEGGIQPGDKAFFAKARELCDRTGALLMCDEVQVGVGRTGKWWGFENLGVEPDVFTLAKALGGGVPIGAMMCKDACNAFGPGKHASTYGGNPLACAAGVAVVTTLEKEDVLANVAARGAQLKAGLGALAAGGAVKEVRGWGLIVGVELNPEVLGDGPQAGRVVAKAMDLGLLLVPAGPNVVRFVPPLIVTEAQCAEAMALFEQAVKELTL